MPFGERPATANGVETPAGVIFRTLLATAVQMLWSGPKTRSFAAVMAATGTAVPAMVPPAPAYDGEKWTSAIVIVIQTSPVVESEVIPTGALVRAGMSYWLIVPSGFTRATSVPVIGSGATTQMFPSEPSVIRPGTEFGDSGNSCATVGAAAAAEGNAKVAAANIRARERRIGQIYVP
jgi:hypothetical protein